MTTADLKHYYDVNTHPDVIAHTKTPDQASPAARGMGSVAWRGPSRTARPCAVEIQSVLWRSNLGGCCGGACKGRSRSSVEPASNCQAAKR